MPEFVERELAPAGALGMPRPSTGGSAATTRTDSERQARRDLRRQIARLELQLGELFGAAFPHRGIDWGVRTPSGPRVLGMKDLEVVRDALAVRLQVARGEVAGRARVEQANRDFLEDLIAAPGEHKWVRVSNQDIGEPGCKHWHSRPRWGILGLLLNWWQVKISSGCP